MKKDTKKIAFKKKTTRKLSAEAFLEKSYVRAGTLANQNTHLFVIIDKKNTVICANKLFCTFFKHKNKDLEGLNFFSFMDSYFANKELKRVLSIMHTDIRSFFQGLEFTKESLKIGKKTLLVSGRWISSDFENDPMLMLLSIEDATGLMNVADLFANELKEKRTK